MTDLSPTRARAIVERFEPLTVLVVGDVMIDHFLIGQVERISPEAPIPVIAFDHEEYRIGGAANVANNVRSLGGRVSLVGAIGADEPGQQLLSELRSASIDATGIIVASDRPTTRKLRIVASRNKQVARIDFETESELAPKYAQELLARQSEAAEKADIIVVSDYLKGVITSELMTQALSASRARGVPILVDPKIPHLDFYAGCTLLTPNHHEASTATNSVIHTAAEAQQAARSLRSRLGCESVLITRGEHGLWLLDGSGSAAEPREKSLPAVAREVSDVTGAGDTVIATLALGLAAGATLTEAAQLANQAAGLAVARFGPAIVSAEELLEACTNQ